MLNEEENSGMIDRRGQSETKSRIEWFQSRY